MKTAVSAHSSTEEIVLLFDAYDFKGRYGHKLTQCEDFHDLPERAFNAQMLKFALKNKIIIRSRNNEEKKNV